MKRSIRLDYSLVFLVILSAFLNGYNIWQDQYVNTYYTTAVGSMLQSFHNFFFATLDSAGYVTVDKPPVTFWVQTMSAWLFGLHGWSVIMPQALSGVGSVILVYALVKPSFGLAAARVSALAMACTPILASVSRTNNIDSMLVFTLLLAAWLLFRGVRGGKKWSLIGAFALIGVAFNMKMMQAFMVLPAFYLFYCIAVRLDWKRKLGILAASTAIMLVIALSWAVAVDAIPADKRPYIGSSETNSVLELAFGYNGIARLTGERGSSGGGGPAINNGARAEAAASDGSRNAGSRNGPPTGEMGNPSPGQGRGDGGQGQPDGRGNGGGRGANAGGMFGTGEKGPLRLFQSELSGQASWLIPFLVFGCIGLLGSIRRRSMTMRHKEVLFWLAWLLPVMAFFSIAGFFHQYYLVMLAAPVAALFGAGWTQLWSYYRERASWQSWLLPIAVSVTAMFGCYIMYPYKEIIGSGWTIFVLVGGVAAGVLLAIWRNGLGSLRLAAGTIGLLALLIGPLYWAATPIIYGQSSKLPEAGPSSSARGEAADSSLNETALAYLRTHNTGEAYLFATSDYTLAAPYIIESAEKVIVLGGYAGSDPVLTQEELQALISEGKLKYCMLSSGGGRSRGSNELVQWIEDHGVLVPSDEWQGSSGSAALYKMTP